MVIDTSAILAILFSEPEKDRFIKAIAEDRVRLISAASFVESGIVLTSKYGPAGKHELLLFITVAGISIDAVSGEQANIALDAYCRFGKGRHPAGLNYGDCFSYALAAFTGEPLLYKGDDFSKTDIQACSFYCI